MGILHVKVKYWRIFVTSFLCSLEFLLFYRIEYPMRCLWKKKNGSVLWYDCTFKKQCTVPLTLTFDLWRSIFYGWIEYNPISILYKFQIDISSNSWEIKYQNIGRTHTQTHRHTHRHTDRQTDWVKTIPRNPLRGRGNNIELLSTWTKSNIRPDIKEQDVKNEWFPHTP